MPSADRERRYEADLCLRSSQSPNFLFSLTSSPTKNSFLFSLLLHDCRIVIELLFYSYFFCIFVGL